MSKSKEPKTVSEFTEEQQGLFRINEKYKYIKRLLNRKAVIHEK